MAKKNEKMKNRQIIVQKRVFPKKYQNIYHEIQKIWYFAYIWRFYDKPKKSSNYHSKSILSMEIQQKYFILEMKVQFNSSILGLVFTLFSEGNFNLNFESWFESEVDESDESESDDESESEV